MFFIVRILSGSGIYKNFTFLRSGWKSVLSHCLILRDSLLCCWKKKTKIRNCHGRKWALIPRGGGQVVSRDCDLLVWVPCSHLIHLSSEWSTYKALKLRDMDFEIPSWNRFWLLPSRSTKSSRKSRLPANDVSTVAHIREHSVAGSAQKALLATQWGKGPRGGLHERRNFLKLGFWRKKRHLPWGCLRRRRQRGGGIQSRRSSVPKNKVQEKQVEWQEQQEVPPARNVAQVVGSSRSQVVKGLLCNVSVLHPGLRRS